MLSFLIGGDDQSRASDSIGRLLSRVEHSSLVDERVEALVELRTTHSLHSLTVNGSCAATLTRIIVQTAADYRDDEDVHAEALATLTFLVAMSSETDAPQSKPDEASIDEELEKGSASDLAYNADQIMAQPSALKTLLQFTDSKYALLIRLYSLQLIGHLLRCRKETMQSSILSEEKALQILVESLSGPESIRNETILVLEAVADHHPAIQGIIAFEGTFEKLLAIIEEEDCNGVIVQDCFRLISTLLSENRSNIKYFCEIGCLARIPHLLDLSRTYPLLLEAILIILQQIDLSETYQTHLSTLSMVSSIFGVLIHAPDSESAIKTRGSLLRILGRCIRNSPKSKSALLEAKVDRPGCSSSLVYLFDLSLTADIDQASNAFFVVESFFLDNPAGQLAAVASLGVPDDGRNEVTIGHRLVAALTSWENNRKTLRDLLHYWLTARVFALLIRNNPESKSAALATPIGVNARSLFDVVLETLQAAFEFDQCDMRVRIALYMLLCECLVDCRDCVNRVLDDPSQISSLISLAAWNSTNMLLRGIACLFWAFCLSGNESEAQCATLYRILNVEIGLEEFSQCIQDLRNSVNSTEYSQAETNNLEPMFLSKPILFDSYWRDIVVKVNDQIGTRLLPLITRGHQLVIAQQAQALSLPDLADSSVALTDEDLASTATLVRQNEELQEALQEAHRQLTRKTNEAALAQYRLDLAESEIEQLTSNATPDVMSSADRRRLDELEQSYKELQEKHNDLLILLVSSKAPLGEVKSDNRLSDADLDVIPSKALTAHQ